MTAFRHGVASGDPLPSGVLLWTRCTTGGDEPVDVDWWIGPSPSPAAAVAQGTAAAGPATDFTVHVEAGGLEPATAYWYGFAAGGVASPVGRTRTTPAPGAPVDRLRLGAASCAAWPKGYFNAYRNLAARPLDLVVHLGDYIYEWGRDRGPAVRDHRPSRPAVTLDDYRARHAQYRSDPDLQALHARHPMVAVWDDHDLVGGGWHDGATSHVPRRHGPLGERRAAAVRAWLEWMPVRRPDPDGDPARIHRRIDLGDLAALVMLDTRLYGRQRPYRNGTRPVARVPEPGPALLGDRQWQWLEAEAAAAHQAGRRWLVVGNQVMLAPLRALGLGGGFGVNTGQWDGYPGERRRLYDVLRRAGWAADVVVVSGDIHSSWACELPVGAEFVTPSVTSDDFARTVLPHVPGVAGMAQAVFGSQNPHIRMGHLRGHGYVTVDLTPNRAQADWWHVCTVARRDTGERWVGGWVLGHGCTGLTEAARPADAGAT